MNIGMNERELSVSKSAVVEHLDLLALGREPSPWT